MLVLNTFLSVGLLLLYAVKTIDGSSFQANIVRRESQRIGEPQSTSKSSFINYRYTIRIDPESDTALDAQTCYPPDEGGISNVSCRTLDFALQFYQHSSVKFLLASPNATYPLMTNFTFSNEENVAIFGNNDTHPKIPTIKCDTIEHEAGLAFINSSNIVLKSVRFLYCGASQNSTSRNFSETNFTVLYQFKVTLYFDNCTNIVMYNIQVDNSTQATGVVMYNTAGDVILNTCNFTNNQVDGSKNFYGGGGVAIEFTYCQPGDNTCNNTNYSHAGRKNRNARYFLTSCLFRNNRALGQSLKNLSALGNFIIPLNVTHESFGRGGGLSVYFKGDAVNNSISVVDCHFISNHAVWGGGLLVEMDDNTINNTVIISHCHFENNHCNFTKDYGTGGGALRIETTMYFWNNVHQKENNARSIIQVADCNFTRNRALEGGALSIALARQGRSHPSQVTKVSVSGCTFQSNFGRIGSAIDVGLYPSFIDGFLSRVQFKDCYFLENSVQYTTAKIHSVGMGAVYVNGIPTDFRGITTFINNSGSALAVIGTQTNFTGCSASFIKNKGNNGGGIALLGGSLLLIGNQTVMIFTDNYVSGFGGAIYNQYIGQENMKSNINCFMHYEDPFMDPKDWNVRFYFENNTALKLGNSIYSSSIFPCLFSYEVQEIFCWNKDHWIYNDSKCHEHIYTSPERFAMPHTAHEVYPGREFNLHLRATDDLEHDVTRSTVYSASIFKQYPFAQVDPRFTYIADNAITINGQPERNFTMGIETATFPQMHIELHFKMKNCPLGFVLQTIRRDSSFNINMTDMDHNDSLICECLDKNSFRGYLQCDKQKWRSRISTRFWIGFESDQDQRSDNSSLLLMGYFPPVYSYHRKRFRNYINLSDDHKSLDEKVCGDEHRMGVLCGECVDGFAVAVNSFYYECVPCNGTSTRAFVGHLVSYVALTYLPVLVLLFVIFYFNVKLTSSAAAGFILYAQMISSGIFNITAGKVSYLDVGSFPRVMQRVYRTMYGIFNLDSFANLMPSFCLNEGFTTLDVICLDYATAAFPLVVIIITHFVYRYNLLRCKCSRRSRIGIVAATNTTALPDGNSNVPKMSLIHTFIAFILLSYTKFSIASMSSMYTTELFNVEGRTVATYRVYLAGHLSIHSRHYLLPYGLLAMFVFIFIVLLPPLLLLGPLQLIDWLIEKPRFQCLHKVWPSIAVHTFLDTFQGFYKPNRRFFAGFYFLFRLVVFLSYCFTSTTIQRYTVQQIVTSVMIVLISIFQPYKTNFFNHVDTLIFFNLAVLNALALYTTANSITNFSIKIYAFECILVWMPLSYMGCYLVWSIVRNSKYYPTITAMCLSITNRSERRENRPLLHEQSGPAYLELTDSFTDVDKGLFKRAEKRNMYHPTTAVSAGPRGKRAVETTVVSLMQDSSDKQRETKDFGDSETSSSERNYSGTEDLNTSNMSTSL